MAGIGDQDAFAVPCRLWAWRPVDIGDRLVIGAASEGSGLSYGHSMDVRPTSGQPAARLAGLHRVLDLLEQAKVESAIVGAVWRVLSAAVDLCEGPATKGDLYESRPFRRRQGGQAGRTADGKTQSRWGCTCFFFNTQPVCLECARWGRSRTSSPKTTSPTCS